MKDLVGSKVIVRGDRSGVFFGTLAGRNGREVELNNCRRLWYWEGAATISQIAAEGVKNPKECKFTISVDNIVILDGIEIIRCTPQAIKSIEEVKIWKK